MSTHLQKYAVKTVKSRDIMSIFLMFSVHRKQTPFVVVGSLKIYEICMIWGGIGEGSVETSLLCFCMRWGHAGIQEFLCQKAALTTFLVLNFTEGAQWLFQTKLYMYIFFYFYFFFLGGGGGGGPNANFYRNPYSL